MSASKFPNDQNSKLVDENGLTIDATNPLDVSVKNFPSSQTVQIDASGNAIKIDQLTAGANGVEVVNTPTVKVENEILPGGAKKSLTVDGSVIVTNVVAGNTPQPLVVGGTIKLDQTTAGANHTELVDASGSPIGLTANPLVVAPSTSFPIVNTAGDVLDVEIKNGSNTAAVDANGRLAVNINAGGVSPSVTASLTSIATSEVLNVKTTGTDAVAVTGSVNIGTMPAITVSDVGIKTTANTIKIDQATAGANHIQIVDKTNTSHVATVGNNGSVHTVITNDNASAVPTTITNTPSVNATIQNASIPVTGTFFQATQPISGNVGITGTPSVTISGTPSVTGNVTIVGGNVGINAAANTVKLDSTANTVQVSGTPNVAVTSMPTTTVTGNVGITGSPIVNINQGIAGANHVEIVNAGGLENSSVNPLFTNTVISNTPNVNISNASVNVTASSNLPIQGMVGISTINGIAPTIDANGLVVKVHSGQISLTETGNSIKIDQATPGANHVEIVNSAGAVNGAATPLFTSAVVTNDVSTVPDTRHQVAQISNAVTYKFISTALFPVSSGFAATTNIMSGITGFRVRIDKIEFWVDPTDSAPAGDYFNLNYLSGGVKTLLCSKRLGATTTGEESTFEPPLGGLLLPADSDLQLENVNIGVSSSASTFEVIFYGAYV
jgi:hypothetical protein